MSKDKGGEMKSSLLQDKLDEEMMALFSNMSLISDSSESIDTSV
eukprot:CAMPEP_0184968480 /NCGR_PEP_ID=MMETSP1098-20130426/1532_1 /TAXON_ID=89044 /ORGANISM="Spumella elongata, Strain CCAP 955/1" /LENGTH=43 /DNA_ID= /DNA_START= /DNA_END= /DNA_ORIENTATION=